jgi:hypothetical protein
LETLASELPRTKSRVLRFLLPDIELALASGKTVKEVWQSVADRGFDISYKTFCASLRRLRKKARVSAGREEGASVGEEMFPRGGRRSGTDNSRKTRLSGVGSRIALRLKRLVVGP